MSPQDKTEEPNNSSCRRQENIVLGVTGSVAAYKAGDLVRRFLNFGWAVSVLMTKEAAEFVSPTTFAALSGKKTQFDMFDSSSENWPLGHIDNAQKADVVLIAPATANIIAKMASGLADDLLTCTVLATKAPVIIAPAMNEAMYKHPATQLNCRRLKEFGYHFVGPVSGKLACGDIGDGHLADIEMIFETVKKVLAR